MVGTEMWCHIEKNNETTGGAPENTAPFLPEKAAVWLQCPPPCTEGCSRCKGAKLTAHPTKP